MQLSHDELVLYLQCLNEVLRGFKITNFDQTLGISKQHLHAEDEQLRAIEKSGQTFSTILDIPIRPTVINATISELEWEFQIRTGFEISEAKELLKRITTAP